MKDETITITFGECAENHIGMQQLGERAERGIKFKELDSLKVLFENKGHHCVLVNLNDSLPEWLTSEKAGVLIVRDGVRMFNVDSDAIFKQLRSIKWDTTMYSVKHKREVNKLARHNICIAHEGQEPSIKDKKGTVYSFDSLPDIKTIKDELEGLLNKRFSLLGEGNRYYNVSKCGIGYHGDTERKVVVAARFGASMKLVFKWYHQNNHVGDAIVFDLHHGDIYFMSEKATGWDWKKRSQVTLRHAAGCKKYIGDV
jgi:hypothetical protein